jgi:hypothetical protein
MACDVWSQIGPQTEGQFVNLSRYVKGAGWFDPSRDHNYIPSSNLFFAHIGCGHARCMPNALLRVALEWVEFQVRINVDAKN